MDYANILDRVCDEWDLTGFHRATYELHAEKLREIAQKYQSGIGYDYEKNIEKCQKLKKRHNQSDIGGDALELLNKKYHQNESKSKRK